MNALTNTIAKAPVCFDARRCNGWILLSVAGDLDELGIQELERRFARVVTQSVFVAVELSGVVVADDSLDDVLSGMDRLLRAFGGRFVVLGRRRARRSQFSQVRYFDPGLPSASPRQFGLDNGGG